MLDSVIMHPSLADALTRELDEVSLIFERQLASELSAVNALCKHVEQYRGKMLRPTLVLLSGVAAGREPHDGSVLTERHRVVAAVTEIIHMATLVHDDVLDEAQVRRRGATLNHLHGNETAVMLGDYLISNAFHLCSTLLAPEINLSLGEITNTLCQGELVQLHHRDDYSIDEQTYFKIIDRKTASLIGECCRLGAWLSDATDEKCESMREFGRLLGIAFQIQDDLLDLIGEQSIVGKSLGKDLEKGKLTLPAIYLLAEANATQRGKALRLIQTQRAGDLSEMMIANGSVRRARKRAESLVNEAVQYLDCLSAGPSRSMLKAMAEAVVARRF